MIIIKHLFDMSLTEWYYMTAYFLLYSVIGWVVEVIYNIAANHRIVNRGFLNGPVCPIYGVGMILVLLILYPVSDNLPVLFIGGCLFATSVELLGGAALYRLFHMRWWDYTNEPYNFRGYICLKFSLLWGLGTVLVIKLLHPFVELNVNIFNRPIGYIIVAIAYLIFVADVIITTLTVMHLNKDLSRLNHLAGELRKLIDDMTEHIGEKTTEIIPHIEEAELQMSLGKAEMADRAEALRAKLITHRHTGYGRLYLAFPDLKHDAFDEELKAAKEKVREL